MAINSDTAWFVSITWVSGHPQTPRSATRHSPVPPALSSTSRHRRRIPLDPPLYPETKSRRPNGDVSPGAFSRIKIDSLVGNGLEPDGSSASEIRQSGPARRSMSGQADRSFSPGQDTADRSECFPIPRRGKVRGINRGVGEAANLSGVPPLRPDKGGPPQTRKQTIQNKRLHPSRKARPPQNGPPANLTHVDNK